MLLQQIEPLVGGAMPQFLAEHRVERIDIRRAGGDVGERGSVSTTCDLPMAAKKRRHWPSL